MDKSERQVSQVMKRIPQENCPSINERAILPQDINISLACLFLCKAGELVINHCWHRDI